MQAINVVYEHLLIINVDIRQNVICKNSRGNFIIYTKAAGGLLFVMMA